MSSAFPTSAILIVTFLLFTHYIQRGFGGMTSPLRQLGMFLLTKASGPATDLFQEKEGCGAKTWMQTGVFWFVIGSIGGFLAAWHSYDPTALDSLSNIGWSYDDGSALAYFNEVAMTTALFAILLGGAFVAHTRMCGSNLASEANASLIAIVWTLQALVGLVLSALDHWDVLTYGATQMALYGLISALLVLSLLVNSLITLGNRGEAPISVPSWFLILALVSLIFSRVAVAAGELFGLTETVWIGQIISIGWVPLALMFAVGYHVISHVTGMPIWSGSLTKASMLLLFVTIPPFFLTESGHADNLTESVGAILVTVGLMPIFAASTNMIATMRGNASAVIASPGATAAAGAAILLPVFAILSYFTGLNVMIGDGSLSNVADSSNMAYFYTVGGLFAMSALFHSYPLAAGKSLKGSAGTASWLVIFGGLLSTILFLMYDWTENSLLEVNVTVAELIEENDVLATNITGFALTGAFAFYGLVLGYLLTGNAVVKTLMSGETSSQSSTGESDITTYSLVEGTTSIRALFGRGVGIDTELVISESEEEGTSGSTIIEVSSDLHNDEVDEFPADPNEETKSEFDPDLVALTRWLCARGTTTAQFFDWADVDDSGEIDELEFANALLVGKVAELPPYEVDRLVKIMDINSDGKINLPELDIALLKIRTALNIEFVPYVPEEVEPEQPLAEEELESADEVGSEVVDTSESDSNESSDEDNEEAEVATSEKPSQSALKKMKKQELVDLAKSMDLPHSGTKADIIERINQA